MGLLLAWAFGSFLFFKIAADLAFRSPLSVMAALLLSIVATITLYLASYVYAMRLLRFNWQPGAVRATMSEIVFSTLMPFFLISVIQALVSRAIIFGFSKELSREIRVYAHNYEYVIWFVLIALAPMILHYLMSVYGTYTNANRR